MSVTFGDDSVADAAAEAARRLVEEGVPRALADGDATLWGAEAQSEAAIRLGWLDLPTTSRELLPQIGELVERARAAGLEHVVLAGMGGPRWRLRSSAPRPTCR